MKNWLLLLIATGIFLSVRAQETYSLEVKVTAGRSIYPGFLPDGRLLLFICSRDRPEPRNQIWPSGNNFIAAKNISDWDIADTMHISAGNGYVQSGTVPLDAYPEGTYYLQIAYHQNKTESRVDGPGNLYSQSLKIDLDRNRVIHLELSNMVPDHHLEDHSHLEYVELKSDVLSDWWDKSVYVKAAVLLPKTWFDQPDRKYPVRYNISGYGGRFTRANGAVREGSSFYKYWFGDEAPQVINVYLDGEGPFGDCYQLDSENSGPYGQSLTEELIPHIEKIYRGIGTPESRFLDGCSTGGWVSLALQVFYSDFFGGCFSYSPDPVDFEKNQLINIYKDEYAYVNEYGYLRPVMRDTDGEPRVSMRDFVQFENTLGPSNTYLNSGGQFSAFSALYGPRGDDGLPQPLFDPFTGKIDHQVAEHWRKYDIKHYLKENWSVLGPKLQGKIWIWMGDMDHFYLNPATRALSDFLNATENPKSDAKIRFSATEGHCSNYDQVEVIRMIGEKL